MSLPAPYFNGNTGTFVAVLPETPVSLSAAGYAEVSIPYAHLVPAGHTTTIYLNEVEIQSMGPQVADRGEVVLSIESPIDSGIWAHVPARVVDGDPTRQCFRTYGEGAAGLPMKNTEELCAVIVNQAYSSGISPDYGTALQRQMRVILKYSL